AILFRLLKTAERTPASSARFFTVGVFSWLLTQIVVNIMAMTSLLPVTGITLPFLSQGGTSMLFISIAIGISLQLSCYTSREVIKDEDTSSRRGVGRTYNASRRRNS
ncbi:MAG: FtsW/RodA/SpoVE family cell cycle protein, partial [Candidatus Saccharibacteria bacterium]|nr:FtsW/RodA/SpoVE family cell cycle protein [Candidatus Saccharibacteria bacterium]